MSLSGTYELQSQENFEAFMSALGFPDSVIQMIKDVKSVTQIVQDGNHFVVTVTTGQKVQRNEFNIGEETEMDSFTGDKIKATVNLEGGKLVVNIKDVHSVTELSGDLLINTMTFKGIVYKKISKKVA